MPEQRLAGNTASLFCCLIIHQVSISQNLVMALEMNINFTFFCFTVRLHIHWSSFLLRLYAEQPVTSINLPATCAKEYFYHTMKVFTRFRICLDE